MELSKQVTSLEISKKLKKLWFQKESLYYYSKISSCWAFVICSGGYNIDIHPVYTGSELMEYLPAVQWKFYLTIRKEHKTNLYKAYYFNSWDVLRNYIPTEESLADCLWKLLIYLIENNLLSKDLP